MSCYTQDKQHVITSISRS